MSTILSPEEHGGAQVIAYFNSLTRGNGHEPPYVHKLALGDYLSAAGYVGFYENDPNDHARGRLLPTAIRRYSFLDHNDKALDKFLEVKDSLADQDYWSLLGHIWVFSKKVPRIFNHRCSREYSKLFASTRPCREYLMAPEERITLLRMRPLITVYRGCQTGLNEDGLSWSLDRTVAEDFARTYYPFNAKSIIRGNCKPEDAIAYFNYSKEQEVIIRADRVNGKKKVN